MSKIDFDQKGRVVINNLQFNPNSLEDVEKLKNKKGWELESIKFDIYDSNLANPKFLGYLDIFFNGIGGWRFIDWVDKDGQPYVREDVYPLFINSCMDWKEVVLSVIEHVQKLHDENIIDFEENKLENWVRVGKPLLQRFEQSVA